VGARTPTSASPATCPRPGTACRSSTPTAPRSRDNDFDNSATTSTSTASGSAASSSPTSSPSSAPAPPATPVSSPPTRRKQTAPSRNLDSEERFAYRNGGQWRILVPKTDRWQFATFLDRPLTARVDLFADVLFYRGRTRTGRPPVDWDNVGEPGIYVPAANPWNPFGTRFYHPTGQPNSDGTPRLTGTPADVTMIGGLMLAEAQPRVIVVDSFAYRALAGLRGRFGDGWQWESAVMYSGAQSHEYEHFFMRESWLRQALGRTDATALNPFGTTFRIVNGLLQAGQPYTNPAAVIDPLYFTDERFGRTGLYVWDAKVNGQLGRLFRGGRIGLASGVEVRHETYQDQRPVYSGRNPPGSGSEFPYLREGDNDFLALSSNMPIDAAADDLRGVCRGRAALS
jgi:iron complex outermembrane receptor protein